jgi:ketosteroid isomerase-like protein
MGVLFSPPRKENHTMRDDDRRTLQDPPSHSAVEHIYHAWDDALGRKDADAALALYAPDAILESPLVRHLLGSERGIRLGRDELRPFIELVLSRTPPARKRHRTGLFTDGERLLWEYPRVTPHGEQMDLVEVMDVRDGLIQHHRVYWGWLGLRILERDGYRR